MLKNVQLDAFNFTYSSCIVIDKKQRDRPTLRVIEYLANSLKITKGHSNDTVE